MSAESQPDHKRLHEPAIVDDVADALAADLDANIGGTIYTHVRTVARRHGFDYTHNRIGVAIRHIGASDEYDIACEPSNPDAQRPTWTITREGER